MMKKLLVSCIEIGDSNADYMVQDLCVFYCCTLGFAILKGISWV